MQSFHPLAALEYFIIYKRLMPTLVELTLVSDLSSVKRV